MLAISRELVFERALERRARFATLHKGIEVGEFSDEIGVAEEAERRHHHEIADGEAIALEPLLVAEPVADALQLELREIRRSGTTELGPLLAGKAEVDQKQVDQGRLDAVERGIGPADRTELRLGLAWEEGLALLAEILKDRPALEQP